jgi:hypothetical protein
MLPYPRQVGWGTLGALVPCRKVPCESTATGLEPHRPHGASDTHRRLCGSPRARSRADRSDPPRPHAQTPLARGGTHSDVRLMNAESQLGTLPFSALKPSQLHTRSGLGRSAALRRTRSNHVPVRYPRALTTPSKTPLSVPLQCSLVTSSAKSTEKALLLHRPHDAPNMHRRLCCSSRARSRADRSDPPRPHAQAPLARMGGTHSCVSNVSAESELGTLPLSALKLRSLHTRSGLGRSAPCYAAPTATMCPYGTRPSYPPPRHAPSPAPGRMGYPWSPCSLPKGPL